ncbi:MAG TPA: hypothetical protein VNM22_11330 [Candidatus Limnocylindrales bacterium]|nr:hypothetical protein [Candidatus Limnocylindrales bacterium]
MKIRAHKIASVTRNLVSQEMEITDEMEVREGNLIVVKALEEKLVYDRIELTTGRMAKVAKDDIIVGALGGRKALKGFVGKIPESIRRGDILHILNLGGVIGIATSGNPEVGNPLRVEVLGMPVVNGKIVHISQGAIPWSSSLTNCPPLVVVAGTCMSAGKTQAATEIIHKLTEKKYRVVGAKVTGVACLRDTLNMQDHGALAALSFLDAGLPSTAHITNVAPVAKGLFNELSKLNPDVIVVELGDGIVGGYNVGSFLKDPEIQSYSQVYVMCANDLVGAWGAVELMKQFYLEITVMTGPATDAEVGKEYIETHLKIPAANARLEPRRLAEIVENKLNSKG